MRIALTGTVCVGKSSVADKISHERSDICVVPEAARQHLTDNPLDIKRLNTYRVQHDIANMALREFRKSRKMPHVLYDRTPLDAAAYYLAQTGDKDFARVMASGSVAAVKSLDRVVMLSSVGVELMPDAERPQNHRERALFEEALDDIYRHEEIDYLVIHGDLDERTNKIIQLFPAAIVDLAV